MSSTTSDVEAAKRNAANLAVKEHFPPDARYIGIGSGSTIVYVVEAIVGLNAPHTKDILFVPTGYQSRQVILKAGLKDTKFDSLPEGTMIDVAFDGADEVDEELNCIKGGGACLYQEKLVAMRAKKFVCVAGEIHLLRDFISNPFFKPHRSARLNIHFFTDHRKLQPRLLTKWPTIPVEVEPLSTQSVLSTLHNLGSPNPQLRMGHSEKSGPLKTDQDNFIVDAPFPTPLATKKNTSATTTAKGISDAKGEKGEWDVETLATQIKGIEGVLSVGLFCGVNGQQALNLKLGRGGQKPVVAYFGMQDGRVIKRVADLEGNVSEV